MPLLTAPAPRRSQIELPAISFFGRSLDEYVRFFSLNIDDLRGRPVLDVAAGPSSFTAEACRRGIDAVAVDPLFGFSKRRILMCTPITTEEARQSAHALLASDGVPVSIINDSPGFVAQRVVAHIVNVGCDIAQMRIATPEDLDRAVVLGLSYPRGPLAMGDAAGAGRILEVLEAMHDYYQEPRYRPSPWLKRRAKLGISLLTLE